MKSATSKKTDLIVHKNRELTAILEVSRVLTASFELEKNLQSVMSTLGNLLEMQRGCVFLLDPVSKELRIVAAHGLTKQNIGKGKYRIGEGIVGRVLEKKIPMVIPNIGEEPLFLNKTGSRPEKDGVSFLCVPIEFKKEVLGVLSVDRIYSKKHGSVDDDLRVLKIIASLIAQFVKLWESYEEVEKEKENLKRELKGKYSIENIIGQSDRMQEVFESVHRVAPSKATVILRGESGTGKELIAKAIHYMSPRSKGPFIKFNCASIPEGLLESELFGHEKGAFTGAVSSRSGKFEIAHKGTIFLDEIGDLPITLQPKILRVLQEREFERVGSEKTIKVDVRIVTATSRNLEHLVSQGKFRDDLYFRLNVIPILLPPLRDRGEDISTLIDHFSKRFNKENNRAVSLDKSALQVFLDYDWPGNVRELENTIERLVIMSSEDRISSADLPVSLNIRRVRGAEGTTSLSGNVAEIEKINILGALEKTGGNQAKAARLLGITPRQIGYKIKKYGLEEKV
ncbi:MAG TPA: nif-specific transcriptional activator NifA [Nitrospirae bacterium]|nr:nitrogen fixation protein VnfA [bacterium BMS3Abin10]GBE39838.1 nitrogen fixation protein VnfA [bacterium BMS3Bbin08]HDH51121.1 nif-specific transcriptional activator NifA [Nitrospirota bacterium]HDK17069.1 nif-specific transcriptional activator NifA [Nitrospirota bacterium]HDK41695.1 nif-specific transcriptional activator NifA [Nitrospirota bacterium]